MNLSCILDTSVLHQGVFYKVGGLSLGQAGHWVFPTMCGTHWHVL
jgi:hypothetical protein